MSTAFTRTGRDAGILDTLDTWEAWEGWRDAVLAHYCSQARWGCPIGALASELIGNDPVRAAEAAAYCGPQRSRALWMAGRILPAHVYERS